MKRILVLIITASILLSFGLVGCNSQTDKGEGLSVVCSFFPQYDWVKNIIGECQGVELSLLVENGVDVHSYQPSVRDISKIASCDLFIYVGGESEAWVSEVIDNTLSDKTRVISLIELLGDNACHIPKSESEENNHAHDHEDDCTYDEHVWLSLKNAGYFSSCIADVLSELDPSNAEGYRENNALYAQKLSALDEKYQSVVDKAENKTLLFADRFPFVYLTNDYDINYIAAFAGCSAETEASFETVAKLSSKISEHSLECVIILEGSKPKLAQTVIASSENKNCKILIMNSIQSVTKAQAENGTSYIGIMEENLTVLELALG